MKRTLLLLTLIPLMARADYAPFDSIVDEIAANNPELKSLTAEQAAEITSRRADNMLEATEVGFDRKWSQFSRSDTKTGFEITQGFDWPGAYGARRKALRSYERMLNSRRLAADKELRRNTRLLLLDVVDANIRCTLLQQMVMNLDSLHTTLHLLLERREVTELDHRKTALEEIAVKQQLAEAEAARTEALSQLAALNGGSLPAGAADLHEYPDENLLELQAYLASSSPEAEAMRLEAESARLDARAERMGLLPGFSVGYGFEREDGTFYHGFSLGLRLPEYSAGKRSDAARLQASALELKAEQADTERRQAITANHRKAEITEKLLADYRTALGNNYLQLLQRCISSGQMTYAEYFTELNFYLSAHLDYFAQQLAYHRLLALLSTL